MNAGEPEIGGDELGVLPAGSDQVHEVREFFETEQKEQMRVPVAPERPESLTEPRGVACFAVGSRCDAAERNNDESDKSLESDQARGMSEVPREHGDEHRRNGQVTLRDPLERAVCGQRGLAKRTRGGGKIRPSEVPERSKNGALHSGGAKRAGPGELAGANSVGDVRALHSEVSIRAASIPGAPRRRSRRAMHCGPASPRSCVGPRNPTAARASR